MSIFDEITGDFGEEFFDRSAEARVEHNWCELCVCGHLDRYHSPAIGGTYRVPAPITKMARGVEWHSTTVLNGCRGAISHKGFETETQTVDQEAHTLVITVNPTCPCLKFQPIARVDRPNRFFNQRIPAEDNRANRERHPFMVGIRAFTTYLSRRKAATADPSWARAELDRRFAWLDGKRVCGLSKCEATDGVWPVYIDGERSELRCSQHR